MAFFLCGLRNHTQEFSMSAARIRASMMFMAVISLMVPGGYHTLLTGENLHFERYLNTGIAVVLLASYALRHVFMLRTHPEVFAATEHHVQAGQARWALPGAR
jgi:Ca2+:H+ antiporter